MGPNTLEILYEDEMIIVCVKPPGIATQSRNYAAPDMESLLKTHISNSSDSRKKPPYLAVIHRLDQPVQGILVFAKTPAAARYLNKQLQDGKFVKYYLALTAGAPPAPAGNLENYLKKEGRSNTSSVCQKSDPDARIARLHYKILRQGPPSLLEIHLDTGRHHQIRVQLAHMGCPIEGDTKYNPDCQDAGDMRRELKLCAYRLSFPHPSTHKAMTFETTPSWAEDWAVED